MVGRRRRRVRRFVFTAALAAAIIAFGLWLAGPFRAPQGYVVTAYAAFDATQTVPSLFTPIDEDNWRAISDTHSLSPRSPIALTLDGLRAQLSDIAEVSSSQDRVVVSLTSHGIAKDQHAFLLGDRFQPVLEESMLVSVSEILDAVRAMPGRTKIIIIDAGQIRSDARLGAAVNQFPTVLAEAVRQTNDPNIWVLSSHSQGEISQLSYRLGQSVFGHFVQRALSGEADTNADRQIDIGELTTFVSANTSAFVAEETGGRASQTPLLLRGDANSTSMTRVVMTVPGRPVQLADSARAQIAWDNIFKKATFSEEEAPKSEIATVAPGSDSDSDRSDAATDAIIRESHRLAEFVAEGWVLRDTLLDQHLRVANRPHLFRAFEQILVGSEHICRFGRPNDIRTAQKHLREHIALWKTAPQSSADAIADEQAFTLEDAANPNSKDGVGDEVAAKFDSMLTSLKTDSLATWIESNWTEDLSHIYEFRIVPRLLRSGIANPKLIDRIVRLRKLAAEAVDAKAEVAVADTLRITAEQLLLEKTSANWAIEAERAIENADMAFRQSLDNASRLQASRRLRDLTAIHAHNFCKWHLRFGGRQSIWTPTTSELTSLIQQATALADGLADSTTNDPTDFATIEQSRQRLQQLYRRIESIAKDDVNKVLELNSHTDGRPWLVEQLLATAIPSAPMRAKLLVTAQSEALTGSPESTLAIVTPHNEQSDDDEQLARLSLELLRLASSPNTSWRRRIDNLLQITKSKKSEIAGSDLNRQIRRLHYHGREQITGLHKELSGLDPDATRKTLNRLQRTLESLDPRDASLFANVNLSGTIERLSKADRLQIQHQRFRAFIRQTDNDHDYLSKAAAHFASRRTLLFPMATERPVVNRVRINGKQEISLTSSAEQTLHMDVRSPAETPIWLVAEYDDSVLDIVSSKDEPVYGPEHIEPSNADRYKAVTTLPVTKTISTAGEWRLPLKVRRKASHQKHARVILTAVTPKETVRKAVEVQLPGAGSLSVFASGVHGTWTSENGELTLHPLPNQTARFQLGLQNYELSAKTVDVGVFAIPEPNLNLPSRAIPADEAVDVTDLLSPGTIANMPKVTLAGGESVRLAFPKLAAPKKPKPEHEQIPLDYGIAIVVSDHDLDLVSFHRINMAPQRPRRYVHPIVKFDARLRRLQIGIAARQLESVPKKGIRVTAELDGVPVADTVGKLTGVIKPDAGRLDLDIRLPRGKMKARRLLLHIDDYPRAFVYDISPIQRSGIVNESTDQLAVAITQPDELVALNKTKKTLLVQLRVDAPLGAFANSADQLVVGLDLDRDRDLTGDPRIVLRNDRFVRTTLHAMGPSGLFEVATIVTDQTTKLPLQTEANGQADLMCRLEVDGHTAYAKAAAPVYLDSVAPKIVDVALPNGNQVGQGGFVHALVTGMDHNLSGIESVEAAFDVDLIGDFAPDMKLHRGTREEGIGWRLRVPTKGLELGRQSLLVRAIDRAGNTSRIKTVSVAVLDKNSVVSRPVNSVQGTIAFGNLKASDFKVSLTAIVPKNDAAAKKDVAVIPATKTNKSGEFNFDNVPVGKYELSARGMLKNMNLSGSKKIDVIAPPAKPVGVTLSVRLKN